MSSTFTEDNNPIQICRNRIVNPPGPYNIILQLTSSGPGVVESISFSSTASLYNSVLTVNVDGTSWPVDLPTFFGLALNPGTAKSYNPLTGQPGTNTNIFGGINNENYIANCDPTYGWAAIKRVFIPFTKQMVIYLYSNSSPNIVDTQVVYRLWPSAFPLYYSVGQRRKWWGVMNYGEWASPIVITPYSTVTTPTITGSAGMGQIESITQILYAVNKANEQDSSCIPMSCLEGEYTMTIDGVANTYSRSDNFWGGHYYWQNGNTEINGPNEGLMAYVGTSSWVGDFSMQAYKYCYDDPIFFNQSFTLSWMYGNPSRSQFGQGVTSCQTIFIITYWVAL